MLEAKTGEKLFFFFFAPDSHIVNAKENFLKEINSASPMNTQMIR